MATRAASSNYTEMISPIIPLQMMGGKAQFDDFVGVWDNFMPSAVCHDLIDYWKTFKEQASERNMSGDLQQTDFLATEQDASSGYNQFNNGRLGRHDYSLMLESVNTQLSNTVNQYLQACVNHYCTEFNALASVPMASWNIKFQETPAGGGYHVYHHENGNWSESSRVLVWMIYLNDDFEGGETEFFYQKRRIEPTQGTVVVWPAGFTHTHRGNLVLEGTKYVVTGWYYIQSI